MKSRPARGRRARYHHGNLRRALVDAALALVERHGVEALSLREAARRAGVSQAAPYRHFADKQALLAAVAEEGFRAMAAAMRAAAADAEAPLPRLQALGLAYVRFATGHASHFRVMFGREVADRGAHPSLRSAAAETFGLLEASVAACQEAGLVVPGPPAELALAAWSAVHGLSDLLINGQLQGLLGRDADALAEELTRTIFLGLAPRPV